jgi:SAM-dependent methyltransferase
MNALSDNMPLEGRESRQFAAVRFKSTDEVLDAYLTCTPLAHALHRAAEAHQLAKVPLHGPILDLGCGTGEFASLAMTGKLDMGVDLNVHALDKVARTGCYQALECADARQLPFADGRFQTVLAVSVLEHITQPHRALAEAFRVLRPGGCLIATIVLADLHDHLFVPWVLRGLGASGLARLYCQAQDHLFRHHSLLSRAQWRQGFKATGFRSFASRRILTPRLTAAWDRWLLAALPYRAGLRFAWHPRWFRRLAIHWYRDPLRERSAEGSNLLVVARKPRSPRRQRDTRLAPMNHVLDEATCHACVR